MMQPPIPLPTVIEVSDVALAMARYRSAVTLGAGVDQEARRLAELMASETGMKILGAAWEHMRAENERGLGAAVHGSDAGGNVISLEERRR